MGVFEDLTARLAAAEAKIAEVESRLTRAENVAGVSRKEAARILGVSLRALDNWIAPGHPRYDADLAACSYMAGGRREFHPHRLEAYRVERMGKGGRHGRKSRVPKGRDAGLQGPEQAQGDRAA
jgi:hypothetical protein